MPSTDAVPPDGGMSPRRILRNVLFPAPFAPTNPIMPDSTSSVKESSARTEGKRFVNEKVESSKGREERGARGRREGFEETEWTEADVEDGSGKRRWKTEVEEGSGKRKWRRKWKTEVDEGGFETIPPSIPPSTSVLISVPRPRLAGTGSLRYD
jgi:hypothetical protein